MPDAPWLDYLIAGYAVQPPMKPSAWAASFRILTQDKTAFPGPWHNDRTPYLVEIMDAAADPAVRQIVVVKATQTGVSEASRNVIGWMIDRQHGPMLQVMPSEAALKEAIEDRIEPMLSACPALARHRTGRAWDLKESMLRLDSMTIYGAWAGSPQALATRPCRAAILDEIDKYPPWSGREADPIELALERLQTFGDRSKAYLVSTPTLSIGPIWRAWQTCDEQRRWECRCPKCGAYQELSFGSIRWDAAPAGTDNPAAWVERHGNVRWVCPSCQDAVPDAERWPLISAGRWSGRNGRVTGFHLSALISPWRTWSMAAGKFLASKDDAPKLQNFRNSWLAEPFEIRITTTESDTIRKKLDPPYVAPARIAPEWGCILLASADVQADHFWYVIRAWGYGYRSQLVHSGMVFSFPELRRVCLESAFPIGATGHMVSPSALIIDSGHRTDEVYQFARANIGRVFAVKGASTKMIRPWHSSFLTRQPGQANVELRLLDVDYYKDMLSRLMSDEDVVKWALNTEATAEYIRQITSEHKVVDRKSNRATWQPITAGAPNHFWDCETYQCAGADWANVGIVPEQVMRPAAPAPPAAPTQPRSRAATDFSARAEREARPGRYTDLADL